MPSPFATRRQKKWIASSHLFGPDTVRLGRLTLDVEAPHQEYHDPPPPDPSICGDTTIENFHRTQTFKTGTKLEYIISLVASRFEKYYQSTTEVTARKSTLTELHNVSDYLEDVCRDPSTRNWLERRAITQNKPVYMVVGTRTVTDASINIAGRRTTTISLEARTPTTAPMAGVDIFQVSAGPCEVTDSATRFNAPRELIYAVQFRKLVVKKALGQDSEKFSLGKVNRWVLYMDARKEGSKEECYVDVELGDDADEDDLNEGCEGEVLGDDVFYCIPES